MSHGVSFFVQVDNLAHILLALGAVSRIEFERGRLWLWPREFVAIRWRVLVIAAAATVAIRVVVFTSAIMVVVAATVVMASAVVMVSTIIAVVVTITVSSTGMWR